MASASFQSPPHFDLRSMALCTPSICAWLRAIENELRDEIDYSGLFNRVRTSYSSLISVLDEHMLRVNYGPPSKGKHTGALVAADVFSMASSQEGNVSIQVFLCKTALFVFVEEPEGRSIDAGKSFKVSQDKHRRYVGQVVLHKIDTVRVVPLSCKSFIQRLGLLIITSALQRIHRSSANC